MSNELLDAATYYASLGWRVIPLHRVGPDGKTCSCRKGGNCASAGKHPKTDEWQNTPRMSAADIHATWDVDKPPNLGLAVGEMSNFWVVDIDPKNGGMETMKALVALHGRLPDTFVVETGSGGFHYYFALPEGVELRNSADRVGKGIDTRANGGQVVAAPSRSSVGNYRVVQDVPLAQAPAWLVEAARKLEVDPASVVTAEDLPKPDDLTDEQWKRLSAYARKAIGSEVGRLDAMKAAQTPNPADYRGEAWNHTTFQVACSLIEFANSPWNDYSLGHAYQDVFTHAPRDVEFDDYTVNRTFESARERIGDKARPMPEDRRQEPPEEDPLFAGPDVRNPGVGGGPEAKPVVLTGGADRFFDKKDLLIDVLDAAVRSEGPVGWGRDNRFWSYDNGVWSQDPDVVERRCVSLLEGRFRNSHVDNVSTVVKHAATPISGDPLYGLMNFRNGMLDWKTGEMMPHDPRFRSAIQFPHDYDPDAECPTFDAFLADVMHDDYVSLAWEMIGYLLFSGNPMQVAFLLYGSGGNGKGTLVRVIEEMLGRHNVANESLDQLNKSTFSAVNLYGKIANIAGDIDSTYQESTANFKKLTGEDMIGAEHKYGARFSFENWAVPLFSANKIPGSADVTDGYLRRWIVLHFHKTITKKILGFSDLLQAETPGIIAKAIPALRDLMARGEFAPHGEAVKGAEEFALHIDQVRQWVASGDAILAPASWSPLRDLYASYAVWAERSGRRKVSESEFGERLEAIGFPSQKHAGITNHQGLTVSSFARHTTPANMFDEE